MHNCFGFRSFKILGNLAFSLFTLYSNFMICFIFLCLYYTGPFKIPSINVTWEFYQNSRQTKMFKKTMKSLNIFWKQSICTTFFWLSLNSLNLTEGQDTLKLIQKHRTQWRNLLENLPTVWTIWKFSRHSGKFPHNL